MRVLVADDDPVALRLLDVRLQMWGYEPVLCSDGAQAWALLQQPDAPVLALLDWMMPGLSGPEVCSLVRAAPAAGPRYVMLLTARGGADSVAEGLAHGADDYLAKPFDHRELQARLAVGARVMRLEQEQRERLRELEAALERERVLKELLPVCSYCHNVRDGADYWQKLEDYLARNTTMQFSHGICPDCVETAFGADIAAEVLG